MKETIYEKHIAPWKIERLIGEGSYGEVYELSCRTQGRLYKAALKVVSVFNDEAAKEAVRECELLAKLRNCSNVVGYGKHMVIDGEVPDEKKVLLIMELMKPFEDIIEEEPLDEEGVIRLAIDVCKGLSGCHSHGIIHRDIKLDNIFKSYSGVYKIGDFGVARSMESTMAEYTIQGSFGYMAPEVFLGKKYGRTADIYSVGLIMYKLLNKNRMPFVDLNKKLVYGRDQQMAFQRRMKGEKLEPPALCSEPLTEIILKACEFSPENRYQSADEMKRALYKLIGYTEEVLPVNEGAKAGTGRKAVYAVSAVVLYLMGLGIGWLIANI